jgi:uncharacterized protein
VVAVAMGVVVAAFIVLNPGCSNAADSKAPEKPAAAPASATALPRIIDLGATKCIPCKAMAPVLEGLKKEFDGRLAALSKQAREAWENRDGPAVFATVGEGGVPNIIYVTCVGIFGGDPCVAVFAGDRLVVADNYFDKTRKNLKRGSKGAILFRTKDGKAYQVKGQLEYHSSGPIFDHMKTWNPKEHPGHAAAALLVEEVYSGAEKVC